MPKKITLGKLKQNLQKVFNEYIRLRDEGKPCVSCGQYHKLQAGHYYAVSGYDGLRFNEDNVHGECARCNCWDESHLIGYGFNIENRIGKEKLEALHQKAKDYKQFGNKWTRYEIQEMIKIYKNKVAELK